MIRFSADKQTNKQTEPNIEGLCRRIGNNQHACFSINITSCTSKAAIKQITDTHQLDDMISMLLRLLNSFSLLDFFLLFVTVFVIFNYFIY